MKESIPTKLTQKNQRGYIDTPTTFEWTMKLIEFQLASKN